MENLNPSSKNDPLDDLSALQSAGSLTVDTKVVTNPATSITSTSAVLSAKFKSEISGVTEKGICYGILTGPTTLDKVYKGDKSKSSLSTTALNLISGTTYYVRGYYKTKKGTFYGNEISFKTLIPQLVLGQSYQGGTIAYILKSGDPGFDSNIQHGLIVSPNDFMRPIWSCNGYTINNSGNTAIGTGLINTNSIITYSCYITTATAAQLSLDLVVNGFDDWYLPSLDEAVAIFSNAKVIPNLQTILDPNQGYWTSSQVVGLPFYQDNNAYYLIPTSGIPTVNFGYKTNANYARAIRSF
ncbi:MAG: hypothetical protein RL246_1626 [Bacteroidota bacterium]|jgi:hypothetical protein